MTTSWLADLIMPKSQLGLTLMVFEALLLDLSQSYSLPVTETLFSMLPVAFTLQTIFSLVLPALFNVPISHSPVLRLYLPEESSLIQINDFGSKSRATTPVAVSRPLFDTVIVHFTKSLRLTVETLADLTTARSEAFSTVIFDWS